MKKLNRAGETHITNEGYRVEIIEYFGADNCTIRFDSGFTIRNAHYASVLKGLIRNPYHKSVYGVGYFGVGEYNSKTHHKFYKTWHSMFQRCYSEKLQKRCPTYIGCSVAEEWHSFQNFAKWFEENYALESIQGWQLDKDILVKGSKIYSPETCCFVPQEVNKSLVKSDSKRGEYPIGVQKIRNTFEVRLNINGKVTYVGTYGTVEEAFQAYKVAKESWIKEVAKKWKHLITPQVYQALINYKVEITD